jgi:hypothetical protein
MHSSTKSSPRKGRTFNFPEKLYRVRSACRAGHTSATYTVADGHAVLVGRSEPRGIRRARAFGWGRGQR